MALKPSYRKCLFLILAVCLGPAPSYAAKAGPCDTPAHRAFDFWLGDWQVHTPDGKLAGRNLIESRDGGCVVHEQYTSASGKYRGESLNIYDATRQVWHQTWVDNAGLLLVLEGGIRGGKMVMEGTTTGSGGVTKQRITWTPNTDGSVRQLWESSDKPGQWSTVFDGRYTKK